MTSTVNSTGTSTGVVITPDSSGSLALQTAGTTAVTIDTSQNVGIGTTSPSTKLHVSGGQSYVTGASGAGAYSRWYNNAQTTNDFQVGQGWSSASDNVALLNNNANAAMIFGTNGTERMRIDSSGNLLVGSTTNPSTAKVRVYKTGNRANIEAEQGDAGGYNFQSIAFSNGGTYYHCNFQEGSNQRGSITSNGSNTAYNTGSDYRLKDDIVPMTGGLNKISALKPVAWKWKSNGSDGQGFLAHELQEVVPECVTGAKDAIDENGNPVYQMVDVSYLVATLTAAIQELSAKNDALTARVVALESK